jgi:hypothetical protein
LLDATRKHGNRSQKLFVTTRQSGTAIEAGRSASSPFSFTWT